MWGSFSTIGEMARKFRGPIGLLHGFAAAISAVFTGFVYIFTCLKALGGAFGVGSITQYVGAVTALFRRTSPPSLKTGAS